MDDLNYTELAILQSAELTAVTPFCPEDQEIAEYYDGVLAEAERMVLERHLPLCRYCRARIGMLGRLEEGQASQRIPGSVLAAAKQLTHKAPGRHRRLSPAWAAAAVLVMALFVFINRAPHPGQPSAPVEPAAPSIDESYSELRSLGREITAIDVTFPTPATGMRPGSLISWAEVPGQAHYTIFVLSGAGDVVWTERLDSAEWVMQKSLNLAAGDTYYFRVEAQLPNGRTVSSKHLPFTPAGWK